jgi:glycosyltransferase involved in cell wall biosynthesis
VISVSGAGAEEITRWFGVDPITVIPNAAPRAAPRPARPQRPAGRLAILYLGGFSNPAKGGATLIEAAPALMAACDQVELRLAGPGQPPASLQQLLTDPQRCQWLGWLDEQEKARVLAATDIFLLPSLTEGLPVALLEAMAHGLAIVATRAGGIPEVLTDDVNAVLIPPADADALVEATRSLACEPERRERLGGAALEQARMLNDDLVCARLDALYREVLSEPARAGRAG